MTIQDGSQFLHHRNLISELRLEVLRAEFADQAAQDLGSQWLQIILRCHRKHLKKRKTSVNLKIPQWFSEALKTYLTGYQKMFDVFYLWILWITSGDFTLANLRKSSKFTAHAVPHG